MPKPPVQNPLFDEFMPQTPAAPTGPSQSLVIVAAQLAPEQQLFNQLLSKIDKLQSGLQDMTALANAHRPLRVKTLQPLQTEFDALQREMIVFLDQRLQTPKGLSKTAQQTASQLICSLALGQLEGPDGPAMQAIYERHSEVDLATSRAQALAEMQNMAASAFGLDADEAAQLQTPEQVLAAAMQKMLEENQARQAQKDAHRKARPTKKTAKQKQAEQDDVDASKALRDIYRKLASALHPDREPDERERKRKTDLMVQVNAANDKKDLLALLQLQLQIEQIDTAAVSAVAQDKLRHFNRVLQEQVQSLQQEFAHAREMYREEFGIPYGSVNVKALQSSMRQHAASLEYDLRFMKNDLRTIRDDKALKAWLKEQKEQMHGQELLEEALSMGPRGFY